MNKEYKNLSFNMNTKKVKVSEAKYNKAVERLEASVANSDGHMQAVYKSRLETLKKQYRFNNSVIDLSAQDYRQARRDMIRDLIGDNMCSLILEDCLELTPQRMYKIDLTYSLPLVLAYTFNLKVSDVMHRLDVLSTQSGIPVDCISASLMSHTCDESIPCDLKLGLLWTVFPEIKTFLGDLCRESNERKLCLVDCVSSTTFNSLLNISIDDEETQLLTALSLKLLLNAEDIIESCVLWITDPIRLRNENKVGFVSKYLGGVIMNTTYFEHDYAIVKNLSGMEFVVKLERLGE